ncbi:MAG TPA: M56 family metallopeptidase [Opitutaceae bacterium]|jgi:beta-lactamase regulating signal transducer with metallopeptidase domain|nr:M56 family metallopeptidase [Opitutaceae bacterium]
MSLLVDLTLRGSLVALVVMGLDRLLGSRMSAVSRRGWWLLVPLAFLLPLRVPVLPPLAHVPLMQKWQNLLPVAGPADNQPAPAVVHSRGHVWSWLWLGGAALYLVVVTAQTSRVMRRWPRERLSTNSELLELLEDCKQETGVTAPIGLVVSASVPSPAILGWLRPRILLPAGLVTTMPRDGLRAVMLHELAHFRWFDVPGNWLFTVVRAIHWFNPMAHVAFAAWARFREEAADEAAMRWMKDASGRAYGAVLLQTLRETNGAGVPFGALAIAESINHLKRRMTMINCYRNKSPRLLLAGVVGLLLAALIILQPTHAATDTPADPKAAAVAAMESWMKGIDAGQYEQSWKDASGHFQEHVTAEKWLAALNGTRTPLGKCNERKLVSASLQVDPVQGDKVMKGEFVVAQFESSFDNLKYAVETVAAAKDTDGAWKATGYYIKPKL